MNAQIFSLNQALPSDADLSKSHTYERLKSLKKSCSQPWHPKTCHLIIESKDVQRISWSCRTNEQFGSAFQNITKRQYLSLIHPAWKKMYCAFDEMVWTATKQFYESEEKGTVYCITIPLMGRDGRFYWYDQVLFPLICNEFDDKTSFLLSLYRLGGYGNMWPNPPFKVELGSNKKKLEDCSRNEAHDLLDLFLNDLLTRRQIEFIKTYRVLEDVLKGCPPNRKAAPIEMGISLASYDRTLQRIMDRLDVNLPDFWVGSAHEFALFLNHYFPN